MRTDSYCRTCGREKCAYFDPAYGGSVDVKCPHCGGITGWIRRITGNVDIVSPLPDNPDVSRAAKKFREGEIDEIEYEQRVDKALRE